MKGKEKQCKKNGTGEREAAVRTIRERNGGAHTRRKYKRDRFLPCYQKRMQREARKEGRVGIVTETRTQHLIPRVKRRHRGKT